MTRNIKPKHSLIGFLAYQIVGFIAVGLIFLILGKATIWESLKPTGETTGVFSGFISVLADTFIQVFSSDLSFSIAIFLAFVVSLGAYLEEIKWFDWIGRTPYDNNCWYCQDEYSTTRELLIFRHPIRETNIYVCRNCSDLQDLGETDIFRQVQDVLLNRNNQNNSPSLPTDIIDTIAEMTGGNFRRAYEEEEEVVDSEGIKISDLEIIDPLEVQEEKIFCKYCSKPTNTKKVVCSECYFFSQEVNKDYESKSEKID